MKNKKINNKVLKSIIFEQFSLNEDIIKDLSRIKDTNKPAFIAKNADKFDVNNFPKNLLPTFTDEDIFNTIYYNEDLVTVFDAKDIDKMDEELLGKLLYNKPKIIGSPNLPLNKLESQSVLGLVYNHPDMVDKLPIDKLESEDIAKLLYHDKKGFMFRMLDLTKLKSEDIRNLIYNKPNYVTTLPTKNLTAADITTLIYYNLAFLTDTTLRGLDLSKLDKSKINKLTKKHGNISQYFSGKAANSTNTTTRGSTANASSNTTTTNNATASGNNPQNDQVVIEKITKDAKNYTMNTFPRGYIQYFTSKNITNVLMRNKDLFGLFSKIDLDKLLTSHIAVIITKQPDLLSEFDLDSLSTKLITQMICVNPNLIKVIPKNQIIRLKTDEINKIKTEHPNLAKYF